MARVVYVNELLCFLFNNYDKLHGTQLKPVTVSFFSEDELVHSKECLLKAITKLIDDGSVVVDLPRLPKHQGEKKCLQTGDDIFKLMAIADESNLFDSIPRFVAEDLSRVPFINADAISLVGMLRKMELFEQRMACVEQSVDELKTSESSKSSSSSLPVEVISTDNGMRVCLTMPQWTTRTFDELSTSKW